jgi:hypothetical protein
VGLQKLKVFFLGFALLFFPSQLFSASETPSPIKCENLLVLGQSEWLAQFPEKLQRVAVRVTEKKKLSNPYYKFIKTRATYELSKGNELKVFEMDGDFQISGHLARSGPIATLYFFFINARKEDGSYYDPMVGEAPPHSLRLGRQLLELLEACFMVADDFLATRPEVDTLLIDTAEVLNTDNLLPMLEEFGFVRIEDNAAARKDKIYLRLKIERGSQAKSESPSQATD